MSRKPNNKDTNASSRPDWWDEDDWTDCCYTVPHAVEAYWGYDD